jgi:hypothetical protein
LIDHFANHCVRDIQVIRLLHPYYRVRPDQWGWQNSIRHNLSLHGKHPSREHRTIKRVGGYFHRANHFFFSDCFVKLPLKQTSASGVVGKLAFKLGSRELLAILWSILFSITGSYI